MCGQGKERPTGWHRWRSTLKLTLLPFALALGVALLGIGVRQLWRDEHATWWAASLSLSDLHRLVKAVDAAMAPYYLLMHLWIGAFGDSEVSMRIPSALFVALAAAVVALAGRRIFNARAGLAAGVLLALVPSISFYGQDARPYAMTLLAGVVAIWLLLRAVDRPSILRWLGYAAAIVWLGSSHLVALLMLPAHFAIVYAARRKPVCREQTRWWLGTTVGWIAAVLLAMAVMVPLIRISIGQANQRAWVPEPTFQRVLQLPSGLFGSAPVGGFFVAAGALALAMLATRAQRVATAIFFLLWTVVPPILAYLTFDQLRVFFPRYLLFTVPGWVMLSGYLLVEVASRSRELVAGMLALVSALVYLGLPAQIDIRARGLGGEAAFRHAARFVAERAESGDGIVFTGYDYAHRGFRYEWRRIPLSEQPREVLVSQRVEEAYSWKHPACADAVACLRNTRRIWLVSIDPTGTPLDPLPPGHQQVVSEHFDLGPTVRFQRLWVTELVRKRGD